MMRRFPAVLLPIYLCVAAATSLSANADNEENTSVSSNEVAEEVFNTWVEARAGSGQPVHWIAEGGVYAYPSGEKLFGMVGFDSSTVIWPEQAGQPVQHLTRKTFAYTDPDTGEILTEFNGTPVEPISYPYQLITYRMEDGLIYGDVEQGSGENVRQIKSVNGMRTSFLGSTLFVNASVFLDIPLPGGRRLDAWENYDFFIHDAETNDQPYQMSWQRYGDLPAWAGEGKAIYHLLSWRVERHEDFPPSLLEWARAEKPMWLRPPESIAEIRELQEEGQDTKWGN